MSEHIKLLIVAIVLLVIIGYTVDTVEWVDISHVEEEVRALRKDLQQVKDELQDTQEQLQEARKEIITSIEDIITGDI